MTDLAAIGWSWLSATLFLGVALAAGGGTLLWGSTMFRGRGEGRSWLGSAVALAGRPWLWAAALGLAASMELPPWADLGLYLMALGGIGMLWRHRWAERRSPVRRLRAALAGLGCARPTKDGRLEVPRMVGRELNEGERNTTLWRLPLGVTPEKVRALAPAIESHLGCRCQVRDQSGLARVELDWGAIPELVGFDDFYRTRPSGWGLWVGLGISRRGPLWVDLDDCAHLLVGGMTGGGKSVFLTQACTGLALEYGPEELQLCAIDLKGGCELAPLAQWPHAYAPLADSVEGAVELLGEVCSELARRLAQLREAGVADLFSLAVLRGDPAPWPRLLVVVDELAEATCSQLGADRSARTAQQAVAGRLGSIARVGRAAGVHLLLATQRPDAEAVPGQLKANLGGTVAFRVRSELNSWILCESALAARLPPQPGRALCARSELTEFQAVACGREESRARIQARWGSPAPPRLVTREAQNTVAQSVGARP
ncbi:MAG: FtsK/SpoIIIE domain-containing protein [Candidatus Dormibacteria bacterium]